MREILTADSGIRIEVATEATAALAEALSGMLPQLTSRARPIREEDLRSVIACDTTTLLIARVGMSRVVGTLTLLVYPTLTEIGARIETVVVDESVRRQGVARGLMDAALRVAAEKGAEIVQLTSSPARVAANHLYTTFGFKLLKTNAYYVLLPRRVIADE